jgi:hypothetical protein
MVFKLKGWKDKKIMKADRFGSTIFPRGQLRNLTADNNEIENNEPLTCVCFNAAVWWLTETFLYI